MTARTRFSFFPLGGDGVLFGIGAGRRGQLQGQGVGAPSFPANYATSRLGSALLIGEDWQTHPALTFGKGASGDCSDPPASDSLTATPPSGLSPYSDAHLQYVSDPTFGTVVRGRYPHNTAGFFYHHRTLSYTASDKIWARQVVKFDPNDYTTKGSFPVASNPAHKLMFTTWQTATSRLEIVFHNTDKYLTGFEQVGRTFTETRLLGATWNQEDVVTTEWTDGEWWEYIQNYEIRTPGANGLALARVFFRRLTTNGVIVGNTHKWNGWSEQATGGSVPDQAAGFQFFANRNLSADQYPDGSLRPSDGSDPFFVWYGPHEVVDGSLNNDPYGLQGTGE